jgi:hypothetical protein
MYGGVEVQIILHLENKRISVARFSFQQIYPREKASCNHFIRGWLGLWTNLDTIGETKFLILKETESRFFCCPRRTLRIVLIMLTKANRINSVIIKQNKFIFVRIMEVFTLSDNIGMKTIFQAQNLKF